MRQTIVIDSYFDGIHYHANGPYVLAIEGGCIARIAAAGTDGMPVPAADTRESRQARFLMPGLVEAHAHVFLDGSQLDLAARAAYLKRPVSEMIARARANLAETLRHGITLVRDAGDRFGINHAVRGETRARPDGSPALRSPGPGIRRPARYGSFLAKEAASDEDIRALVNRIADQGADDLKIVLTGIIDFASGTVKGEPQFDARALSLAVRLAHDRGLKTFAHCSGSAGLEVAVAARVDSIEHGFFMDTGTLERMARHGIAWVPTCSPVHFNWANPAVGGWSATAVDHLRRILDQHLAHIALAHTTGVAIVAGSDAGSPGVGHGKALVDELFFYLDAGLPLASVLEAATSRPRRLWGIDGGLVGPGAPADLVLLAGDPFRDPRHLRDVTAVYRAGRMIDPGLHVRLAGGVGLQAE